MLGVLSLFQARATIALSSDTEGHSVSDGDSNPRHQRDDDEYALEHVPRSYELDTYVTHAFQNDMKLIHLGIR